ncbi:shikimate dehydrogenase [Persicitalea sp.]|uniref:shikimate dehydrogenase family protein n=1 Tax=Persicitalea sp. TaxID=3100273 RepID=UPI0035947E82
MNQYGLIGYPLTHSFSKKYFGEKFEREKIKGSRYDLFELKTIDELPALLTNTANLHGLNVTIPYKQKVIPFLDGLDEYSAKRIGAVNTIKIYADGSTKGFNTDYYGFRQSVSEWLDRRGESCDGMKTLVLGTGGSSKAIVAALTDLKANPQLVSRKPEDNEIGYDDLTEEIMTEHRLIVNTTPLGMFPNAETCPPIPYELITRRHFLYDLVYNPVDTVFLQKGAEQKAATHNGLKMLQLQAEKAWDIWTQEGDLWNR